MFMGSKSPVLRARDGMVTSRTAREKRGEPGLSDSRSQSLLIQDRHGMRTPLTGAFPPALPACLPPAPPSAYCLSLSLPARAPALCLISPACSAICAPGTQPTLLGRPSWNKTRSWSRSGSRATATATGYGWSGLVWCLGAYVLNDAVRCEVMRQDGMTLTLNPTLPAPLHHSHTPLAPGPGT